MMRRQLLRFGSFSTKFVGRYWGESFPFYYVIEYPKSGGNWLSHMIAAYLGIPFIERSIFPHGVSCVTHAHWSYDKRLRRVFYLVRDGRDVCVSAFFHARRGYLAGSASDRRYVRARFGNLFERTIVPETPTDVLPRFVDLWAKRSFGVRVDWASHVTMWNIDAPDVFILRYDDLLTKCVAVLGRALEQHTKEPVDPNRLSEVISRFSFERMTGRTAGSEDPASFRRKGVAGDWRNHFTRETGQVFHDHFGQTLLSLKYETDPDWWNSLPTEVRAREQRTAMAEHS